MLRQDGAASCHPDFEEELIALLSIYDSELQVERKASGGVSLHMKMSPAPPAYIKASVTLHIPAAVRSPSCVLLVARILSFLQGPNPQIPTAQCDTFSPYPLYYCIENWCLLMNDCRWKPRANCSTAATNRQHSRQADRQR